MQTTIRILSNQDCYLLTYHLCPGAKRTRRSGRTEEDSELKNLKRLIFFPRIQIRFGKIPKSGYMKKALKLYWKCNYKLFIEQTFIMVFTLPSLVQVPSKPNQRTFFMIKYKIMFKLFSHFLVKYPMQVYPTLPCFKLTFLSWILVGTVPYKVVNKKTLILTERYIYYALINVTERTKIPVPYIFLPEPM